MFPLDLNLLTEKDKKHNPFLNNCANECTHTQSNTKKYENKKCNTQRPTQCRN